MPSKAQRTKGNAKPSSSARTAELLTGSGGSVTGFIGFSAFSTPRNVDQDDKTLTAEEDTAVDSEFRMVTRKLTKKDSVTKIKALQELAELVDQKDERDVKQLLPYWPRLFVKLAVDYDWRVRETTFKTHQVIAKIVGKSIAPHLKQMMPTWLLSTFDSYAPAASAAKSSLDNTFPGDKQRSAIDFTYAEILKFCIDILLNQTAESLGDKTVANLDEIQAKYIRFVSSSLSVLALVIQVVNDETKVKSHLEPLLADHKLWKFAKDKESSIRHAWYKLMSSIVHRCPSLAVENAKKLCSTTFSNLNESDPLVVSTLWEAALYIVASDELNEFCSDLNITKTLVPQLMNVLKEAGRGNAVAIYPNLLPMLSRLPLDEVADKEQFLCSFFENMKRGIEKAKVQSEVTAIYQAYFECIKFITLSNAVFKVSEEKLHFLSSIANAQVKDMMKKALTADSAFYAKGMFRPLVDLISGLGTLREQKLTIPICDTIDELFTMDFNRPCLVLRTTWFLQELMNRKRNRIKSVGFSDDEKHSTPKDSAPAVGSEFLGLLAKLLNIAIDENVISDDVWLKLMIQIMKLDQSNAVFASTTFSPVDHFIDTHIIPWFANCNDAAHFNYRRSLVTLFLVVCRKSPDFIASLNKTELITDIASLEIIFCHIAQNYKADKELASWLLGDTYTAIVLKLVDELVQLEKSHRSQMIWNIVKTCFSTELSNQACLGKVLTKFTTALNAQKKDTNNNTQVITFTCDLIGNMFDFYKPWSTLPVAIDLLESLFKLSCRTEKEQRGGLEAAWVKGIGLYMLSEYEAGHNKEPDHLMSRIAKFVHDSALEATSLSSVVLMVENVERLLDTIAEAAVDDKVKLTYPSLMRLFCLTETQWQSLISSIPQTIFYPEWFVGALAPPSNIASDQVISATKQIPTCCFAAVALSSILHKFSLVFGHLKFKAKGTGKDIIPVEMFTSQVPYLLISLGCAEKIAFHSADKDAEKFRAHIGYHTEKITCINHLAVVNKLVENAKTNSIYSLGLRAFGSDFKSLNIDLNTDLSHLTPENLTALQLCAGNLNSKKKHKLMQDCLNAIVCSEDVSATLPTNLLALLISCLKESEKSSLYEELIGPILTVFSSLKDSQADIFSFSNVHSPENSSKMRFASTVVELFRVCIADHLDDLLNSQEYVDFIFLALTSWTTNMSKNKDYLLSELDLAIFAARTFRLLAETSTKLSACSEDVQVAVEWNKFYSTKVSSSLVEILFAHSITSHFESHQKAVLCCLGEALSSLSFNSLPDVSSIRPTVQAAEEHEKHIQCIELGVNEARALSAMTSLLMHEYRLFNIVGHRVLMKLMPLIVPSIVQPEFKEDEDELVLSVPRPLRRVLEETDHVVDVLLSDYPIASCSVELDPTSDSHRISLAYMFAWLETIELFSQLTNETRPCVALYLKNSGLVYRLFDNLFRLMPVTDSETYSKARKLAMIKEPVDLKLDHCPSADEIRHLASNVYYAALKKMPALARLWLSSQEKRVVDIVNRFTSKYVSEHLSSEELGSVKDGTTGLGNTVVKGSNHGP
ncbi:E3 ubiquitin-protein ligase listerin [Halotydeus destructor]|nr:E3 ubiquitin-protein ligase listerin [Halotydeus destructor]